jgi:hypothetical protein
MYTTISAPAPAPAPTPTPTTTTRARSAVRPGLLGGIGGLVFASSVFVQNALRSRFPANDADAAEVMKYYADHRTATIALAVMAR